MRKSMVACLLLTPLLAVCAAKKEAAMTIVQTGDPGATIEKIAISADGSTAAYTLRKEISYRRHRYKPGSMVCINPGCLSVTSPNVEWKLRVIDTTTGKQTECVVLSEPHTLTFTPNGASLIVGANPDESNYQYRYLRLFNTGTGTREQSIGIPIFDPTDTREAFAGAGVHACFNREGTELLSTDYYCRQSQYHEPRTRHSVTQTDLTHGTKYVLHAGVGDTARTALCAFSPDSSLATAQVGEKVLIWDLRQNAKIVHALKAPRQTEDCLCISPDNTTLCVSRESVTDDTGITMFDLRTKKTFESFSCTEDLMRTSFGLAEFEIAIPMIKALRAHRKFLGQKPYTKACVSDDGATLLTEQDGQLYLIK